MYAIKINSAGDWLVIGHRQTYAEAVRVALNFPGCDILIIPTITLRESWRNGSAGVC